MILFSALLLSMFITIALIPILRGQAVRLDAVDIPNERKVHQEPMPIIGGIAMALGAVVPVLLWASGDQLVRAVLISSGILVFIGFLDDLNNLDYKAKFASQLAAALIVIFFGGLKIKTLGYLLPADVSLPNYLAIPLTVVAIVGVTNAINLSDGLDGLAGGISLLSFVCIGFLAYQAENMVIAVLSFTMIGAIFGFLRFNTHPATIFMGDAGSQLIGFLVITLALALTQGNTPLSPLLPLLIIGFPVLDTVTVMLERIITGKSPFVADKNHFHHKLMRLGFYHTEAVLHIYIIQAILVSLAYFLRFSSDWLILLLYLGFSAVVICTILVFDKNNWQAKRLQLDIFKGRLKTLKEKQYPIRVSYFILKVGAPALLLLICFLPTAIPPFFSMFAAGLAISVVMTWFLNDDWRRIILQWMLFLIIPFIVYLSETDMTPLMYGGARLLYNISFGVLVVFMFLTLKFTRRKKGFKASPMDFLVLFIALAIPNLPAEQIQGLHFGFIATKIIILFFAFEILIGDLRQGSKWVVYPTLAALLTLAVRGLG